MTPTEIAAPANPIASVGARTASAAKSQRIVALDFTKGGLVLFMVLYHWINYFVGFDWGYYQYLRFLTPSFIFITGFIVSTVYLSKYDAKDSRPPKRLFTRGLKLMAVFLALNLARTGVVPLLHTGRLVDDALSARNLFIVFVSGDLQLVGGKLVSFSILVPISYLLMLSGLLLFVYRWFHFTFHAVCGLFLLCIAAMALAGQQSLNLEYVTIGMLGIITGFAPIASIDKFVKHPYAIAIAYLAYLAANAMWNVPFPLLVVAVYLTLAVIYLIGLSGGASGKMGNVVVLLGKYSLFGYIFQIAVLQVLSAGLRHFGSGSTVLAVSFVAAFAITILGVEILDAARAKSPLTDKLYKVVFA
jgi:peptidoglycan/LPS O-acetylase OafA/YrhL